MLTIFAITAIELLLFAVLRPVVMLEQYLFVALNAVFVVVWLLRRDPSVGWILVFSFALRLLVLLTDYHHWAFIPHGGRDTEGFHAIAVGNLYSGALYRVTWYPWVLTWLYRLLGECRFIAQYINVLFGTGILVVLNGIFRLLEVREVFKRPALLLAAVFPQLLFFSALLLREAWCGFFIAASLYAFVSWMKTGRLELFGFSMAFVLAAAWMHSGGIAVAVGYLFAFVFYRPAYGHSRLTLVACVGLVVVAIVTVVFLTCTNIFISKLMRFDLDYIALVGFYSRVPLAGSVYLEWMNPKSLVQMLCYAPLRIFYFLFSPLPWNWRSAWDIIAFCGDSSFYIGVCLLAVMRGYRVACGLRRNLLGYLCISLIAACILFGYGTITSGTAIRHRAKLFPLFLTIGAVCFAGNAERREEIGR